MLVSATPLAESSSYWAQGGLAAALAARGLAPSATCDDTVRAGRGAVRRVRGRVLAREAPGRRARPRGARRRLRRRPPRHARARARGRAHRAPRSPTPAARRPGRRITRQLSADVAEHDGVEVLGADAAPRRCIADATRRVVGVRLDDGRGIRARRAVLATGGAAALWARTTNPLGATGKGLSLAYAAGAALADLELVQFHPTARRRAPTGRRRLPRDRGDPRRGRDALDVDAASASSTSSRRATRWRSRSATMLARPGAPSVTSICATSTPRGSRTSSRALDDAGLDPDARPRAGRPRRALHDGRDRHRRSTARPRCPAC